MDQNLSYDQFSKTLLNDVSPPHWKNPKATETYDLLILGGGPGGMTAATVARTYKAKVALVEKAHLGGECLNYGCIPSKAFLRSAKAVAEVHHSSEFGLVIPDGWTIDFPSVMKRVHQLQATISPHDSADHFTKLGVDVFFGAGKFIGIDRLEIGGQILQFKKAIIATGTEPLPLNIPGLEASDYLTNETIFYLTSLPRRLAVIGGGPIACELAQAFQRFGSQVTLISRGKSLLPKDDSIATQRIQKQFLKEGIHLFLNNQVQRVEKRGKEKVLFIEGFSEGVPVDAILVAIGRKPNTEGMNLEQAGVEFDEKKGILSNDFLQTKNPNIYAVGDVTSAFKFTHISKDLAKIAVENALNQANLKNSSLIIPWCTYCDPEIAHVGLTEHNAKEQGINVETHIIEMADMDRAILDGETVGFVKLLVNAGTDQLVGATLMARHAGEMISELGLAIADGKGISGLARVIHPFPTQGEIIRAAAQAILKKNKHCEAATSLK